MQRLIFWPFECSPLYFACQFYVCFCYCFEHPRQRWLVKFAELRFQKAQARTTTLSAELGFCCACAAALLLTGALLACPVRSLLLGIVCVLPFSWHNVTSYQSLSPLLWGNRNAGFGQCYKLSR